MNIANNVRMNAARSLSDLRAGNDNNSARQSTGFSNNMVRATSWNKFIIARDAEFDWVETRLSKQSNSMEQIERDSKRQHKALGRTRFQDVGIEKELCNFKYIKIHSKFLTIVRGTSVKKTGVQPSENPHYMALEHLCYNDAESMPVKEFARTCLKANTVSSRLDSRSIEREDNALIQKVQQTLNEYNFKIATEEIYNDPEKARELKHNTVQKIVHRSQNYESSLRVPSVVSPID